MSDEKRVCLHESGMVAKHGQLSVYSLDAVRAALAVHGLALVPTADVESAELTGEKRSNYAADIGWIEQWLCPKCTHMNRSGGAACRLCGARRAAKEAKSG